MNESVVSVIIVFRNEVRYICDCIASVIEQFDVNESWELILVDSMSEDGSDKLAVAYCTEKGVEFKLFRNENLSLASGWNIGIRNAKGNFVIRPDAHALLGKEYVTGAMQSLQMFREAGVAGGVLETKAFSFQGKIIVEALGMRSGVGNSSFRTGEESGFKDTAVYGLYKHEVFDKAGLFNENLKRHQDTEFHLRLRKAGFKIYMNNQISAVYYCRESVKEIGRQMYEIGYGFSELVKTGAADSMRLRHRIPMFFYLAVAMMILIGIFYLPFLVGAGMVLILYIVVIFTEAIGRSLMKKSLFPIAAVPVIPYMHFMYALGTFIGFVTNRH